MAAPTPAVAALTAAGVVHRVHRYEHDPAVTAFGPEAADRLGLDPACVLKTLVVSVDRRLVVAVLPVAARLDLKALAAAVGGKAAVMAEVAEAERATGYVVGGISPFGQRRTLRTVVDGHALAHPAVYVSGGRRGLEIEVAPADLVAATGAVLAPIARA